MHQAYQLMIDNIYNNRDIYSILYINQHGKLIFVIIRIVSRSNSVNNVGSTYLKKLLVVGRIISNLISFIFNKLLIIKCVICSLNMLLYHYYYSFKYLNSSQLITGFTIFIYWREILIVISQHTSYCPYIPNYYIIQLIYE